MSDLISRQAAIDAIESTAWYHQNRNGEMVHGANSSEHQAWYKADEILAMIENLPSAQPEITLESAIDYLHSIGWMQEHDRALTESAQVMCRDCQWYSEEHRLCTEHDIEDRDGSGYCSDGVPRKGGVDGSDGNG